MGLDGSRNPFQSQWCCFCVIQVSNNQSDFNELARSFGLVFEGKVWKERHSTKSVFRNVLIVYSFMMICLRVSWVRLRRKASKADNMVRMCYRPLNQVNSQMKCSVNSWEKSHHCWSSFSWGTSAYQMSEGSSRQQRANNLGHYWSV